MALSKIVLSLGVMACLCFGGSSLFLKKLYYVYDGLPKSEFVRSESRANVYHESRLLQKKRRDALGRVDRVYKKRLRAVKR